MNKKTNPGLKIICLNRKASFNYFFEELIEAGIVLKGSEIKSIRDGKVNIADSYAVEKDETEKLDKILQPIHNSMFIESNPSPVKYAAKLLGLCEDDVRLPLVKITELTKEAVKKALVSANLL